MLKIFFLDMNSFFASVEQQVKPSLRGRPVAVAPMIGDAGCCIAASYEAKAFGVRTGTRVGEAKDLCPSITIVDARPRLYVMMHQRVIKAIDKIIPVDKVHSIDEFSCTLDRSQRTRDAALDVARRVKESIRQHCGVSMRCSVGIAPNRPLAKLGTDLMKPDGLVIYDDADIPGAFAHLSPQELAGIGPKTTRRLERAGIRTIADLLACDIPRMRELWGSLWGERWYTWLRGGEVIEPPTHKRTIGHQHVLAPGLRTMEGARAVAYRLLLKALARMRHERYAARRFTLGVRFEGDRLPESAWSGASWDVSAQLGEGAVDTPTVLDVLGELWSRVPLGRPILVSVTLHDLVPPGSVTLPLFADEQRRTRLSKAMDSVNQKFGANTVFPANMQHVREHGSGGIAFASVPDLALTDSVQSRQRDSGPKLTDEQLAALLDASLRVS